MRIVFVNRYFWPDESATAQLLSDLSFYLSEHGHEVTVITGQSGYRDAESVFPPEEKHRGVQILRAGGSRSGRVSLGAKLLDFTSFLIGALPIIRRESRKADWLVSLTDPPMLSSLTSFFIHKTCKRATWCMDLFPEIATLYSRSLIIRLAGKLLKPLRDATFRKQDALIALGKDMENYLVSLGIPNTSIFTIRTWGLEELEASDSDAIRAFKKAEGIKDGFIVGYSGNLGRVHEPNTVAQAVESMPEEWPGQFLFYAAGRNLARFESSPGQSIQPWIDIRPPCPRSDLNAALAAPDVHWFSLFPHFSDFVFPSKFAGILAAGKPVLFVGKEGCEIFDMIKDSGCGFAIHAGDHQGFIEAVETLREQEALRIKMGRASRILFEKEFRFESAMERWMTLFV